jgi:hypothetical protein
MSTLFDSRITARDAWIDRARAVKTDAVLRARGILTTLKGRTHKFAGPCPMCGGTDRFAVNLRKGRGGSFNCRGCRAGGNTAISLVMWLDQCVFLRAVETLAGAPPDTADRETDEQRHAREQRAAQLRERLARDELERKARDARELRESIAYCERLWAQTVPLPAEVITYFARRGIALDDVPEQGGLRFHPRCPFDGPMLPCIVARFTDAITGTAGGIWRRPITGEKPKTLGPMRGHVIRLWPDDAVEQGLVLGEGVETVLAAGTRITDKGTRLQPAWACGCADNLENFPLLAGLEALTLLVDHDASGTGQHAAEQCARRWREAGREVVRLIPGELGDFNDLVMP